MEMQAVNQFKLKQREAMKKLKTDYATTLSNLKQAKKALQEDFDKENYSSNLLQKTDNSKFRLTADFRKESLIPVRIFKNYTYSL